MRAPSTPAVRRLSHPALLFALRFLTIVALGMAITIRFWTVFDWVSRGWAWVLALLLERTGLGPAVVSGSTVFYAQAVSLQVVLECTGLHLLTMWIGVILSFPATWGRRLGGLVVGAAVIGFANLVRLWVAAWVLLRWPARFELVHAYIWQAGMIVVLLGLAAWWMRAPAVPAATVGGPAPSARPA